MQMRKGKQLAFGYEDKEKRRKGCVQSQISVEEVAIPPFSFSQGLDTEHTSSRASPSPRGDIDPGSRKR